MATEKIVTFSIQVKFVNDLGEDIDEITPASEGNHYPQLKTFIKKGIKQAVGVHMDELTSHAESEVTES